MRSLAILILVAVCTSCGGDEAVADAAGPDSTTIDAVPTVDARDRCFDYCDCMEMNCTTRRDTEYVDMAGCLTACAGFSEAQLTCRSNHCGFAGVENNPDFHCPHSIGMGICP